MIAFLRAEPGGEIVFDLLTKKPPACLAHAVNLCEVFYDFLKAGGEAAARSVISDLRAMGLLVREDMDEAFWQAVGRYKVACKIPLADAFAISLANRFGAEIVTTDHGDFEPLARNNVCRVLFIR
jgi:PIN domain nuclease of toxin-antitoxin system